MPAPTLRRQAAAGMRWTLAATIVSTVGQVLQLIVLGRLLVPEAFGLMSMVLIVTGFVQAYTDLGLSSALVYHRDATHEQLSSLYWLNVAAGLAACVLMWIAVPLVVRLFHEPAVAPLLRVLAASFVLAALGRQFEVLFQRDLAFRRLALLDMSAVVAGTGTAIGLALAGAGVWALVGAVLATVAVKGGLLLVSGWRWHRPLVRFNARDVRGFLGFGLYQVGERTVNFVGERMDQLLVGRMLGAVALGFYGFAFNLVSQPVSRINPIVTRVAFPTLALVQNEPERLRRGFLDMCRLLTTVNAPLLLGLAAVAPVMVPALFGAKWGPSVLLVQLLSIVALSRSVGNPIGSLQLARGRADLGFKWNILFVAIALPAVFIGARLSGAVGIAIALLVVQGILQLLSYPLLVRPLLGACGPQYATALLRPTAHALVMVTVVAMLPAVLPSLPALVVVALQVGAGALLYVTTLALFERPVLRELRGLVLART